MWKLKVEPPLALLHFGSERVAARFLSDVGIKYHRRQSCKKKAKTRATALILAFFLLFFLRICYKNAFRQHTFFAQQKPLAPLQP